MKVFINPGHDLELDPGAVNKFSGLREADVVAEVGWLVKSYLEAAGLEVMVLQSDSLNGETASRPSVCETANTWPADIFVSIHCNAAENTAARGTETLCFNWYGMGAALAGCIQKQIVDSLGTLDRGVKQRSDLTVLRRTDMPACLVEMAFISNEDDEELLVNKKDEFARAIARGVTDYQLQIS